MDYQFDESDFDPPPTPQQVEYLARLVDDYERTKCGVQKHRIAEEALDVLLETAPVFLPCGRVVSAHGGVTSARAEPGREVDLIEWLHERGYEPKPGKLDKALRRSLNDGLNVPAELQRSAWKWRLEVAPPK